MSELKSCPFCGDDNARTVWEVSDGELVVYVHCGTCGSRGETLFVQKHEMSALLDVVSGYAESAEDSWNWRPD